MSSIHEHENLDDVLAHELLGLNQRIQEDAQPERQKLGFFTVVALILNRTIGSGIFVTPRNVLLGTRSVGASLILWVVGALASFGGLLVWLELGLSIPRHIVPDGRIKSVPRSGGEKNYLEYVIQSPKFFATCLFGIIFIVLGNLSGNGVQFGIYAMRAAGYDDPTHAQVVACSIAALTAACLIHVFSRRGGIVLSNLFAIFKVAVLVAIIVIGFAVGAGAKFGGEAKSETPNFRVSKSFANASNHVSSYSSALLNIFYSFSGFEQPFYVLSEVRQPRKIFPRATLTAMGIASTLFFLVNVAYICAIPVTPEFLLPGGDWTRNNNDMTVLFFGHVFGSGIASRIMAGVAAACIFGNLIVMTFTASRVKQEIAKEGILPFSLFFATGHTTPDAWFRRRRAERKHRSERLANRNSYGGNLPYHPSHAEQDDEDAIALPEQSPMAALLLHWVVSLALLGCTAMLPASRAYFVLVFLYSYVLVVLVPFMVTVGLLYLRFNPSSNWNTISAFKPLGGPSFAIFYGLTCLFLLITPFLDPGEGNPWSFEANGVKWWILPTIGLSSLVWGPIWWAGLRGVMWKKGLELVVTRTPHIELDEEDGEWVQRAELIDHVWLSRAYARGRDSDSGGGSMTEVRERAK